MYMYVVVLSWATIMTINYPALQASHLQFINFDSTNTPRHQQIAPVVPLVAPIGLHQAKLYNLHLIRNISAAPNVHIIAACDILAWQHKAYYNSIF